MWRGLDFVDGLAAKYPEVIDYYLRDGKDRLEATVQRLLSIAGLKNPADSPASSTESLKELHAALNQFDPHFHYDFSVQMLNTDGTCPPLPAAPTAVASLTFIYTEQCITYDIIPRFKEALKERPVPGSMTFSAVPGSSLHAQLDDWTKYGTPLKEVPAKDVSWDLPGGFDGSWGNALVTTGASRPLPGAPHETVTLRVLEMDGTVAASLDFVTDEASSGIGGRGARNVGHDTRAGLVRYELRMLRDDKRHTARRRYKYLCRRACRQVSRGHDSRHPLPCIPTSISANTDIQQEWSPTLAAIAHSGWLDAGGTGKALDSDVRESGDNSGACT